MITSRSGDIYADFLLPHLRPDQVLVDVGCGDGELSRDLAERVARVIGIDDDPTEWATDGIVERLAGDAYALPLGDRVADVVFAHSVLEALDRPGDALAEMVRVLKPGGLVAVASVEYGGLILHGPHADLTRRFYDIREALWLAEGAFPYRGRELRGLLRAAGLDDVEATTRSITYGTENEVREFGLGRAEDCWDEWYVRSAQHQGLATAEQLEEMREAWLEWAESPTSYAAFAWCRAHGRKPERDRRQAPGSSRWRMKTK